MTKVPDLNLPDRKFGHWQPDKAEVHQMRYWKAKKAKRKTVHAPKSSKKNKWLNTKDGANWYLDKNPPQELQDKIDAED